MELTKYAMMETAGGDLRDEIGMMRYPDQPEKK